MKSLELESEKNYSRDILFWAGISGILVAMGYFIISVLFAVSGFPLPVDGASWISYLNGKIELWNIIIWLSIITDILYIVIAFGFLKFYENKYKFLMLLATIFFSLFVVLELAGTWSIYPTIIELYKSYSLADSVAEQTIYLGAIEYGSTHFQTIINGFYAIILPAFAVIIYSFVMLRDKKFGKLIPTIGLMSGICNIISVLGGLIYEPLEKLVMPGSFLVLFWFLGLGIKFIRKSKQIVGYNPSE